MSIAPESAPEEPVLLRDDAGGITTLTLNRPAQYNALNEALLNALYDAIDAIERDESVRVVVLAANGKGFCSGHDFSEMKTTHSDDYYLTLFTRSSDLMLRLLRLAQPVIARVQGIATANGCNLVATCDLAVAASDARFAVSGVNYGLFCSTPSVGLSRNISRKRAFEMLITGEFIDAETARDFGLVNRVVPAEALDQEIASICRTILSKSAVAVATGKRMFYSQAEKNVKDAYKFSAEVMARNMMSEDASEGVDAFLEKRPPVWKGR